MELLIDFIRRLSEPYQQNKRLGIIVSASLMLAAIGLVIFSGFLINAIEFLGILLGSLGGIIFFALSVFVPSIFFSNNFIDDIKHKFSISVRKKVTLIVSILYLVLIVMVGGDGTNPWIGASTVFVFGWLTLFFTTTMAERKAIDEAAEEIIWIYENEISDLEQNELDDNFDDSNPEAK